MLNNIPVVGFDYFLKILLQNRFTKIIINSMLIPKI